MNLWKKIGFLAVCAAGVRQAGAASVNISQVYGGGGNTGAQYTNDFVELLNTTDNPISLTGYSIQYTSTSGTFSTGNLTTLSGTIPAKSYWLVSEASGGAIGVALPTADNTGGINLSATNGKVALSMTATAISGPADTNVVDFVGYGTANAFEGSAAAPAGTNTTADIRLAGGLTDTNNNSADFTSGAPTPRNSSTSVPEPTAIAALGAVSLLLGARRRRRV